MRSRRSGGLLIALMFCWRETGRLLFGFYDTDSWFVAKTHVELSCVEGYSTCRDFARLAFVNLVGSCACHFAAHETHPDDCEKPSDSGTAANCVVCYFLAAVSHHLNLRESISSIGLSALLRTRM